MAHRDRDGNVELTTTEARQGSPRHLNLRVLVTSLVLAALLALVLYTMFYREPALQGRKVGTGGAASPSTTSQPVTRP